MLLIHCSHGEDGKICSHSTSCHPRPVGLAGVEELSASRLLRHFIPAAAEEARQRALQQAAPHSQIGMMRTALRMSRQVCLSRCGHRYKSRRGRDAPFLQKAFKPSSGSCIS